MLKLAAKLVFANVIAVRIVEKISADPWPEFDHRFSFDQRHFFALSVSSRTRFFYLCLGHI